MRLPHTTNSNVVTRRAACPGIPTRPSHNRVSVAPNNMVPLVLHPSPWSLLLIGVHYCSTADSQGPGDGSMYPRPFLAHVLSPPTRTVNVALEATSAQPPHALK